ncbi:MAG: protein kinase [Candidatus Thiodiazotropha sp.]
MTTKRTDLDLLVKDLEGMNELDARYSEITCVNYGGAQPRRGVLSLVFQARDIVEDKLVALKFMDPGMLGNRYRIEAFEREPEILEKLVPKKRCITLTSGLEEFGWELAHPTGGETTKVPLKYFAVDWLEEDVDEYFFRQHEIAAVEKLKVFRKVLLAVASIHSAEISHRDLKADNLRAYNLRDEQIIAAIDFGTAAHIESSSLISTYDDPVGALAYAAPETCVGFAGDREIGFLTDIYALGCLLYQLFNRSLHFDAIQADRHYLQTLLLLRAEVGVKTTKEDKIAAWAETMVRFAHSVHPPSIDGNDSSLPLSISHIVSKLHREMTCFDYRQRISDLNKVRYRIESAIKVLENEKMQHAILQRKRQYRVRREEKIKERDRNIREYARKRECLPC